MTKTFYSSDHHFNHANILNFKDYNGCPVREFDNVDQMNEAMIDFHNSVVGVNDTCYFLGDVSMTASGLQHVKKMNGRKILIKGNHDIFKLKQYTEVFEDIRAFKIYPEHGIICSHIPLHPSAFERGSRWKGNVHGHLHVNNVRLPSIEFNEEDILDSGFLETDVLFPRNLVYNHKNPLDERYLNVSVEQINFTPVDFEYILEYFNIEKNKGQFKQK